MQEYEKNNMQRRQVEALESIALSLEKMNRLTQEATGRQKESLIKQTTRAMKGNPHAG